MEKLVLHYCAGDGFTYSCDINEPFLYESKEKAEYDLLEIWEKTEYKYSEVTFAGIKINLEYLTYYDEDKLHKRKVPKYAEPTIFTLDEWFNKGIEENYLTNYER